MSHVKKEKFSKTKSCNDVDISDTTRFFLGEEWRIIINNHVVLKMNQDFPRRKNKVEGHKRMKYGNRNGTRNTSNINTDITQAAIIALHTSQPVDNSIPS